MSLSSIQKLVHDKILNFRRIENLSKTPGFSEIFLSNKDKLIPLMLDGKIDELEIEVMTINRSYTYQRLFALCKQHHVTKYSRLTKAEMLSELVKIKAIEVV